MHIIYTNVHTLARAHTHIPICHTRIYIFLFSYFLLFLLLLSFRWKEQYLCNWHKRIDGIWETYIKRVILFDFTSVFSSSSSCTIEFLRFESLSNRKTHVSKGYVCILFLVEKENMARTCFIQFFSVLVYVYAKKSFNNIKLLNEISPTNSIITNNKNV